MKEIKAWLVTSPLSKIALGGLLSVSFGLVAHAQASGNTAGVQQLPGQSITTISGVTTIVCNVLAYFFWIVLVISVIMVLFAAYTYVTAAEDTEKTSKARRTLTYAAVGIAVAFISTAVPSIVSSLVPGNPSASLNETCTGIGL